MVHSFLLIMFIFRSKKILIKGSLLIIFLIIVVYILVTVQQNDEQKKSDYFLEVRPVEDSTSLKKNVLINFTSFGYTIKSKACDLGNREILGIILVTSYVGHDELRSAHRLAVSKEKLQELGFARVFLIAEIPSKEMFITQSQILNEHKKFQDLVQGNFIEAYRNLTYKHTMGLKYAISECPSAKFVIKVDDDIVFDIFRIKNYLENIEIRGTSTTDFIAGYVQSKMYPIRLKANKWYVSHEEFEENSYPNFASGWLYLTTSSTAKKLVYESERTQFFWIDDVFITGIIRDKLQIPLVSINDWFSANSQFLECCIRDFQENSYECDFFAGPNGGDNKLITMFLHGVEKCYFDECIKRPPEKSLKSTCVGAAKDIIQDHGNALIKPIILG